MLHLFTLAASQWYTMYYEIVINITCNMIALFSLYSTSCTYLVHHVYVVYHYYLLYPADTVYPADTMLFIQLIRYCLSSCFVVYPADTIVTVICFYTMLCICDKYLHCLVCIGFAYIIYILQDTYNTLFFNNHDNLFNRY